MPVPVSITPARRRVRRRRRTVPSSPPPPEPAVVTSASLDGTGLICTLIFDRPVTLSGDPPWGPLDGSIQFNDQTPSPSSTTRPTRWRSS